MKRMVLRGEVVIGGVLYSAPGLEYLNGCMVSLVPTGDGFEACAGAAKGNFRVVLERVA